jgi:hypothetical protein
MPRRPPRASRDRIDRARVSLRRHLAIPPPPAPITIFLTVHKKRSSADHDWKTSPIEGCALSVWHGLLGSVSAPAHAIVSGEKHGSRASRRASAVASDRAPGGADASTSLPHIRLPRAHEGWGAMSHLSSRRTSVHVNRRAACPSPLQAFSARAIRPTRRMAWRAAPEPMRPLRCMPNCRMLLTSQSLSPRMRIQMRIQMLVTRRMRRLRSCA